VREDLGQATDARRRFIEKVPARSVRADNS